MNNAIEGGWSFGIIIHPLCMLHSFPFSKDASTNFLYFFTFSGDSNNNNNSDIILCSVRCNMLLHINNVPNPSDAKYSGQFGR